MPKRYDMLKYEEYPYYERLTFCPGTGRYVLYADYAGAERRLVELQEAVRWERECERFDRWATHTCRPVSHEWDQVIFCARAAVEKLMDTK